MIRGFLTSRATRVAAFWSLVVAAWATIVVLTGFSIDRLESPITEAALTVGMGLVLALRVNRAYERWWEARMLWGKLVNVSRNLAVKARSFGRPTPEEVDRLTRGIPGFAFALKDHLRDGASLERVPGFATYEQRPKHVPSWMTRQLYDLIREWREEGRIVDEEMRTLDLEARELLEVAGACERIRNTPMPPSLPVVVRMTRFLMLVILPMTLDDHLGWWTIPAVAGAAFFVVMGESMASVIEHPFGRDPNELDLTKICKGIDTTVREILTTPDRTS